jgi:hypothetical protein
MPSRASRGGKRADPIQNALRAHAHPHAQALSALGASKGGKARAANLSAKRRVAIAQKAAGTRWLKLKPSPDLKDAVRFCGLHLRDLVSSVAQFFQLGPLRIRNPVNQKPTTTQIHRAPACCQTNTGNHEWAWPLGTKNSRRFA